MAIEFEIYFFKPEYLELIKAREIENDPSIEEKFMPDLGAMFCRNMARNVSMRFYTLDEAIDLIGIGYQVAKDSGTAEPENFEREEGFPETMVDLGIISLSGNYKGYFEWDNKKSDFKNKKELRELLAFHSIIG